MNNETKTYFLARYALSTGTISSFTGSRSVESGYVYDARPGYAFTGHVLGRDVFETYEEAREYADRVMRPKKIKSIEKQLAKLHKLGFPLAPQTEERADG